MLILMYELVCLYCVYFVLVDLIVLIDGCWIVFV